MKKTFLMVISCTEVFVNILSIFCVCFLCGPGGARGLNLSHGNTRMISSCLFQYLYGQLPSFPLKRTATQHNITCVLPQLQWSFFSNPYPCLNLKLLIITLTCGSFFLPGIACNSIQSSPNTY